MQGDGGQAPAAAAARLGASPAGSGRGAEPLTAPSLRAEESRPPPPGARRFGRVSKAEEKTSCLS